MASIEALLLDTHTFLWASSAPQKLSAGARRWLQDGATQLYLSAASLWEIEAKHRGGQLHAEAKVVDGSMRALGVRPLAITAAHMRAAAGLSERGVGKDPFDWMIAAQAMAERLPLVTGDVVFGGLEGLAVRW